MSGTLLDDRDAVLLDLDGTVYRGGELIPGARDAIHEVHARDIAVRYVTNNASQPAKAVADRLTGLGLSTQAVEVSTSAQAAAAVLAQDLQPGEKVLVVGTSALASELDQVGLVPVRFSTEQPVAVVQGHSPDTGWADLVEACLAIRAGALWIACNGDVTLPTERGELPGNGAMVAALRAATGKEPKVAGKPQRPLLARAVSSAAGEFPLMVGDRLDTDIAGAVNARIPALMVLTGVDGPANLLSAAPELRPDYVAADLSALLSSREDTAISEQSEWKVHVDGSVLELAAISENVVDPLPALRALCAAWWAHGSGVVRVRGGDEQATLVLDKLGLS